LHWLGDERVDPAVDAASAAQRLLRASAARLRGFDYDSDD